MNYEDSQSRYEKVAIKDNLLLLYDVHVFSWFDRVLDGSVSWCQHCVVLDCQRTQCSPHGPFVVDASDQDTAIWRLRSSLKDSQYPKWCWSLRQHLARFNFFVPCLSKFILQMLITQKPLFFEYFLGRRGHNINISYGWLTERSFQAAWNAVALPWEKSSRSSCIPNRTGRFTNKTVCHFGTWNTCSFSMDNFAQRFFLNGLQEVSPEDASCCLSRWGGNWRWQNPALAGAGTFGAEKRPERL